MKVIALFQCPNRRASHNMATLSDTIKPNKTYLEAVLRTALLGKTEDEYVDFVLDNRSALTLIVRRSTARSVSIMVRYTQPGIYFQCLKKLTTRTMSLSLTIWKLKPWHSLERKLEKAILHSKAWDATSITRVC